MCSIRGIPEIAKLGKVVATYPPKDVHALATVMNRALLNAGFWRGGGFLDEAALDLFSAEAITRRYRDVYAGRDKPNVLPQDWKGESEELATHAV